MKQFQANLPGHQTFKLKILKCVRLQIDHNNLQNLTQSFVVNTEFPNASQMNYDQFPSCLWWLKKDKEQSTMESMRIRTIPGSSEKKENINPENYRFQCSSKDTIGLMYNISSNEDKRYYPRLMLTQIFVFMSFEYMLTVNWQVQSSYKEAVRIIGLLKDDVELIKAIREAFYT